MTDELIRLQVRVQQLEGVLREIAEMADIRFPTDQEFAVRKMALAALPTPPSPPTEAHAMRELQVADDDTA